MDNEKIQIRATSSGQSLDVVVVNKGLDVIEASYLFALSADGRDVLVHPRSIIHGLVGALLLGPVGWFLGLVLIREAIRANVEDQRAVHDARVLEAKRQLVEQLQASGHAVPAALQDAVGDRRQLGSGS